MATKGRYAADTTVSYRQSIAEIETLIERFNGGAPLEFIRGRVADRDIIEFAIQGRRIRLWIALPDRESFRYTPARKFERYEDEITKEWNKEINRLWRSMTAVVKAKLIAIEDGISTLEAEFLANLVLPAGTTVGEAMATTLEETLRTGVMPPMVPSGWAPIALGSGN